MKKLSLFLLFFLATFSLASKDVRLPSSFQEVSSYLKVNKKLPSNYIRKSEASRRGWNPRKGNLWTVLPGKSIGGDYFGNREGKLPRNKCGNRTRWYEADIDYKGGTRGAKRIVFCLTQGNKNVYIYKTENHYKTFEEIR
ncbi:MAG: hypothetical protein KDK45_16340 [Leptospiraceae bacterium]|nr:hypothetical protein [Leptospiraceae bacterium]